MPQTQSDKDAKVSEAELRLDLQEMIGQFQDEILEEMGFNATDFVQERNAVVEKIIERVLRGIR